MLCLGALGAIVALQYSGFVRFIVDDEVSWQGILTMRVFIYSAPFTYGDLLAIILNISKSINRG